jgi:serine O-acetyltransferase
VITGRSERGEHRERSSAESTGASPREEPSIPGNARATEREREPLIDALRGDYVRHGGHLRHTGLWALGVYRFGRWAKTIKPTPVHWTVARVYWALSLGVEVGLGVVLPRGTSVGRDLLIVHGASIRVHPDVVIGDRVCIMHEVTIGLNPGPDGARTGAPRIGNDVFIGAGAKVLGPITIGDGARIAANSLVITDVPPGATVVGVPARAMRG